MNRLLAVCLVSLAVVSLATLTACGGGGGGAAPAPAAQPEPEPMPEAQEPSQSDVIKAALNRIVGDADTLIGNRLSGRENAEPSSLIELKPASITLNDLFPSWIGPGSDYEPWGDELPDWPGISMVRRTGSLSYQEVSQTDAGYLEYSAFFLSKHLTHNRNALSPRAYVYTGGEFGDFPYPLSIGKGAGSNPTIEGTWEGAMIGVFKEEKWTGTSGECPGNICSFAKARSLGMGNLLTGDASVSVALGGDNGDKVSVSFTDIVDSVTGAKHGGLSWEDIPLQNGVFSYGEYSQENPDNLAYPRNAISGSFYGPAHLANEVGGVFERNYMMGSFGAKRQ